MPDTFTYYVAAYVATGLLYSGYVASLIIRARSIEPSAESHEPRAESRAPSAGR